MKSSPTLATAVAIPAAAPTISPCPVDRKASHRRTPCPAATTGASELALPCAPAPDPAAAAHLAQRKAQAAVLEKERLKRAARQHRELERIKPIKRATDMLALECS